jgi:hypothetical protein
MDREWKEIELCWFGDVQRVEGNGITKRLLYMNLESTRPRGRPRSRQQDEVREDGRIVGGEGWQEKVYNREEWNGNEMASCRNTDTDTYGLQSKH